MATADFTDIDPAISISKLYREINARSIALRSNESDTSFPSSPVAGQFAFRTDIGWIFQRNSANTAWIAMWQLDNGPSAPFVVQLNSLTTTTWVTTTEVAIDPGGGVETEGIDLNISVKMNNASTDMTIKIPDDANWSGRRIRIDYEAGLGGRITVQKESDSSTICEIDYPGDHVAFQISAAGVPEIVFYDLNGILETVSNITVGATTNFWKNRFMLDCTSGDIVVDLPDFPSLFGGTRWPAIFKKIDASANPVTIYPNGADKIDGQSSFTLSLQHEAVTLLPDHFNNEWRII